MIEEVRNVLLIVWCLIWFAMLKPLIQANLFSPPLQYNKDRLRRKVEKSETKRQKQKQNKRRPEQIFNGKVLVETTTNHISLSDRIVAAYQSTAIVGLLLLVFPLLVLSLTFVAQLSAVPSPSSPPLFSCGTRCLIETGLNSAGLDVSLPLLGSLIEKTSDVPDAAPELSSAVRSLFSPDLIHSIVQVFLFALMANWALITIAYLSLSHLNQVLLNKATLAK